jgi:hypothetical protein
VDILFDLIFILVSVLAFLCGGIAASMASSELEESKKALKIVLSIALSAGLASLMPLNTLGVLGVILVFAVFCAILLFTVIKFDADLFYFTIFLIAASILSKSIIPIQIAVIASLLQGAHDYAKFIFVNPELTKTKKSKKKSSNSSSNMNSNVKLNIFSKKSFNKKYVSRISQLIFITTHVIVIFVIFSRYVF